ncbi:hypothetical protein [Paenibacillus sp. N3.4]|uniref:hypothetical protein n=1 Tax=Paenibacillus sp. N3.4 TaxID=2603222 RepID=UPI0011CB7B52|nr:hypothetical protein [Paenibacillus sp. N3.4]TXK85749.1 hypothetical protein FU659_02245 [Paenibacillus sp. N3.4]
MESITVLQIKQLPNEIHQLVIEASNEGFRHLIRLVNEYQAGTNRFNKHSEALFVAYALSEIVGVCRLNQAPYSQEGSIRRVRRLYVSKDFRGFKLRLDCF